MTSAQGFLQEDNGSVPSQDDTCDPLGTFLEALGNLTTKTDPNLSHDEGLGGDSDDEYCGYNRDRGQPECKTNGEFVHQPGSSINKERPSTI